jgi:hypothetical protein
MRAIVCCFAAAALVTACSQGESNDTSRENAAASMVAPKDAGPSEDVGVCASTFGDRLTPGFGRIDGTLVAIVRPVVDEHCVQPNRDHIIVQVAMLGAVYRMVVNVQSDRDAADTRVRIAKVDAPLTAPAWEEGWHTDARLDYPTTLNLHSDERFKPMGMSELVSDVVSELRIGEKVSVYAINGQGRPESAHKIHRNRFDASNDGAIVVGATAENPKYLVFAFDGQTF